MGDTDNPAGDVSAPTRNRQLFTVAAVSVAVWVAGSRIYHARDDDRRVALGLERLQSTERAAFAPAGGGGLGALVAPAMPAHPRVVIVGAALPVITNVYWVGARIVAQVPPSSAAVLAAWAPMQQRELLHRLFHDRADLLWLTSPDGSFEIVRVP